MSKVFIDSLNRFSEADWLAAVGSLAGDIHEVDRAAVQVWFRFYPLDLVRYLESADDLEATMQGIVMQGDFGLLDKIDTSHAFLYGNRYWPQAKAEAIKRAESGEPAGDLAAEIRSLAKTVASDAKTKESLTLGIAAVALMTLVQTGIDEMKAASGMTSVPASEMNRSPDAIVAERAKDDSQGIFGFLRTVNKKFTVDYEAFGYDGSFTIIDNEEITSASQKDQSREWQAMDERCWNGPVPIECTSASCGTCWIGVIGGTEKLSEPERREKTRIKTFGYNQPDEKHPFLRLACQTKAHGNATIVIPPWNAVFGKKVRGNVEDVDLEPVTTSAKKLRETIADAVSGE
ncbi:MAG: 2Fe-2S iron-sulfur cluster binding domain-containing protein [Acidobacteria bacterium]|nr:2Fe-2S iron-sulfur cluster binding domain-containing protein [Acidobacteriota bacterium]